MPTSRANLAICFLVAVTISCTTLPQRHAYAEKSKEPASISSIDELLRCMATSGNRVRMRPGVYHVTDAAPDNKSIFVVSGSNNHFDLRGVTIEIDSQLLAELRGQTHEICAYRITGNHNTFVGATFEDTGDHAPHLGMPDFEIWGNDNTFRDCTFTVRGSSPYGYGELLGKGRVHAMPLKKHSAMSIIGDDTKILGCNFYVRAFGHAIHMHGADDTLIKDTTIEGELRPSDEILAEKTGPAAEVGHRDIHGRLLKPGMMVALAEDGIRAYPKGENDQRPRETGDITVINCTVKRMRGGITLAQASGKVRVEGCTVTESGYPGHAYSMPSNAVVRNCRGDAAYAPLLVLPYPNETDADITLELLAPPRRATNDLLALINGSDHKVTITSRGGRAAGDDLAIVLGQSPRPNDPDFPNADARKVRLINRTPAKVDLTKSASKCTITSDGPVKDHGKQNKISREPDRSKPRSDRPRPSTLR